MFIFKKSAYCEYHIRWARQRTITKTIHDIVGSIVAGPINVRESLKSKSEKNNIQNINNEDGE